MPRPRLRPNRLPVPPPPLRHRVHSPSASTQASALERVRRIAREHRATEKPFDPERRGSWRGSSRDLVVNPSHRRGDKHGVDLASEDEEGFVVIEDDNDRYPWILVNPTDYPQGRSYGGIRKEQLYGLQFGAYGWTKLLVWSRHRENALEEASGWLAEHAPGIFVDQDSLRELEKEYREENPEADDDEVMSEAYADLTYTEDGYIPSYEWGVGFDSENQGTDNDFYRCALEASKEEYTRIYDEEAP